MKIVWLTCNLNFLYLISNIFLGSVGTYFLIDIYYTSYRDHEEANIL